MAGSVKQLSTKRNTQTVDSVIFRTQPDTVFDNRFYTYDHVKNEKNEHYITGFYKQMTRYAVPFVAKVVRQDSLNKVVWLKLLERKHDKPMIGFRVAATKSGCVVALTSFTDTLQNYLLELDSLGKSITEDTVFSDQTPRLMQYDAINNELLLVYKGQRIKEQLKEREQATFVLVGAGLQTRWNHKTTLQGNVVDIIRSNNTFYAFGNFKGIQISSGDWVQAKANTGLYSLSLPLSGKGQQTTIFPTKTSVTLAKAVKNNSNSFSLLGFRQELASTSVLLQNPRAFYYSIVTTEGTVLFENE